MCLFTIKIPFYLKKCKYSKNLKMKHGLTRTQKNALKIKITGYY